MPTMTLSARQPRRRRRFLGSLRWRLSLAIVGLVLLLLGVLGGVLVFTVNALLFNSATQRFTTETRAIALARHAEFVDAVSHKDVLGNCSTTMPAAFQTYFSDPLTQAPASFQTVALLDPFTGMAQAPASESGMAPADLQMNKLSSLTSQYPPGDNRQWLVAVERGVTVSYVTTENGVRGETILIAYDYRLVTDCAKGQSRTLPAVLMMTQIFSGTQNTVNDFKVLLGIAIGVLFIVGMALGVSLTGASLKRLTRVSLAARRLARGDLRQRVGLGPPDDEIGDLAQTFDEMAEQVELAFRQRQAAEEQMRQFIADASHELRTPLTSIKGYLDLLAAGGETDPRESRQMVLNARGEAARMSRLVEDLLTLARFDAGRPIEQVWTDLGQLAGMAVDQARLLAGERQVTLSGGGAGRMMALVDPDRIKQVLLALLDNALKYGRQDPGGWVRVALDREPDAVRIEVIDNGPGIPPGDLPNIFNRFYRGKQGAIGAGNGQSPPRADQPGGSGLGLAIARTIVAAHGGTISVESRLGQGTRFIIRLPVTVPSIAGAARAPVTR